MITFRVRYMTAPRLAHVYCRVFAAPGDGGTFASLGDLTMRKDEFDAFRSGFTAAEFIEEPSA
jgi:hypothetical protein